MSNIRAERVGEQMKKELSLLFQNELKDPRIGFVTVTSVEVSGDLSQAKVYLSVFGEESQKTETLHALSKAKGYLRSELGKRIRLRHIPELIFKLDSSIEYGNHIESLIREINDGGHQS